MENVYIVYIVYMYILLVALRTFRAAFVTSAVRSERQI